MNPPGHTEDMTKEENFALPIICWAKGSKYTDASYAAPEPCPDETKSSGPDMYQQWRGLPSVPPDGGLGKGGKDMGESMSFSMVSRSWDTSEPPQDAAAPAMQPAGVTPSLPVVPMHYMPNSGGCCSPMMLPMVQGMQPGGMPGSSSGPAMSPLFAAMRYRPH